jgi:hypothetical protein
MKKPAIITVALLALIMIIGGISTTVMAASTDTVTPESTSATDDSTTKSESDKGDKNTDASKGAKGVRVNVIAVAADILGKSTDEVRDAVKDGKVGDLLIAADKVDAFKAAYLAEAKTKLDAAVAAGTITQAQADEKYAAKKAKMDAYDGTTHLCGGKDHSKFGNGNKTTESGTTA